MGSLSYLGSKVLRFSKHKHQKFNYAQHISEASTSFFFFSLFLFHVLELISFKVTVTDLERLHRDVASWSLQFVGTMTKTLIFCFSGNWFFKSSPTCHSLIIHEEET